MSSVYDNWERLVGAALRREHFRLSSQRTPSDLSLASTSSSFSFSSFPHRLSSYQILQATGSLSRFNLIKHGHSGDLFYGVLEGGIQVVVKRIDLSSVDKESYYFITELEILHKISHSRLVPLLGYCLENMHDKFLVYKYIPNKYLSCYLHGKKVSEDDCGQLLSLNWPRLKIAIGAAEGLCYLHHECVPSIVHRYPKFPTPLFLVPDCGLLPKLIRDFAMLLSFDSQRDFQASSILLDDNFEVRLGSLSQLCTAIVNDGTENRIARFLRLPKSFFSKRMEVGQGTSGTSIATCGEDVYCFGKLLLQLVTGKLHLNATTDFPDPIPPMGRRAKNWKDITLRIYDKEVFRKILDPSLVVEEDLFMQVWAVAIVARAYLNPSPSKRPQMPQVLQALRKGKITHSTFFEMTRTIESYKIFLGPISPKI